MTDEGDWITVPAAAQRLGVSERTAHRYAMAALDGGPSLLRARRVEGRRHKVEVQIVDADAAGTVQQAAPDVSAVWQAEREGLQRELEAIRGERDRLVTGNTELQELFRREQELHRATQQQLERLLPAPKDSERRPWWRRVVGR